MTIQQPLPPAGAETEIKQPNGMRPFSWVIIGINALFLIWIVKGVADANPTNDAEIVGTGIGVMLIVGLWAFTDVILGILWLVTRKRQPQVVIVQRPWHNMSVYVPAQHGQGALGQERYAGQPVGLPGGMQDRVSPADYVARHPVSTTVNARVQVDEDAHYMHEVAHAALDGGHGAAEAWKLAVEWLLRQGHDPSVHADTMALAQQQYESCARCPDPQGQAH